MNYDSIVQQGKLRIPQPYIHTSTSLLDIATLPPFSCILFRAGTTNPFILTAKLPPITGWENRLIIIKASDDGGAADFTNCIITLQSNDGSAVIAYQNSANAQSSITLWQSRAYWFHNYLGKWNVLTGLISIPNTT